MTAPVLVIGWGNASRGDDALGPLFVERLQARLAGARIDWLDDYQLQVEHALALQGRERVLFVDACRDGAAPFEARAVRPARDRSFTTHALSPEALLQVFVDIGAGAPPPATLLAIRGDDFALGAPLGEAAAGHLELALRWAEDWLRPPAAAGTC